MEMLLRDLPRWARTVVFVLVSPFLALALIGVLMNLNIGSYIDRSLEAEFNRRTQVQESVANRIIQEYSQQATLIGQRLTDIEARMQTVEAMKAQIAIMEEWACRVAPEPAPWCAKLDDKNTGEK